MTIVIVLRRDDFIIVLALSALVDALAYYPPQSSLAVRL
jgi:hypothetical protein